MLEREDNQGVDGVPNLNLGHFVVTLIAIYQD
jgi:hypothetical protein